MTGVQTCALPIYKKRKYKVVDDHVRATYAKDSKASSTSKLDDAYVKFFRWATDRLKGRDGIVWV